MQSGMQIVFAWATGGSRAMQSSAQTVIHLPQVVFLRKESQRADINEIFMSQLLYTVFASEISALIIIILLKY